MNSKSADDLLDISADIHFSGLHVDNLDQKNSVVDQSTSLANEEFYRQPFLIGQDFYTRLSLDISVSILLRFTDKACISCILSLQLKNTPRHLVNKAVHFHFRKSGGDANTFIVMK